jgi:hypothetical protein
MVGVKEDADSLSEDQDAGSTSQWRRGGEMRPQG